MKEIEYSSMLRGGMGTKFRLGNLNSSRPPTIYQLNHKKKFSSYARMIHFYLLISTES
jgi:hypothetical protein